MSSTSSAQMTEEQKNFLTSLEEEFKDRYTENDEEFKAVLNERPSLPPIVENWGEFRNRDDRRDHYRYGRYRDDFGESYPRRYNDYYDGGGYSHSSRHDYRRREWNYSDPYRS